MSGRIQVLRWAKIAGYIDLQKDSRGWWLVRLYMYDILQWSGPFPTLAAVQEFIRPSKRSKKP